MANSGAHHPEPRAYGTLAVVGAGAWGTALALVAAARVKQVLLWAREAEVLADVTKLRENRQFLPGVALPPNIRPVSELDALRNAEATLLVAPAQHIRAAASRLKGIVPRGSPVVLCATGIESGTGEVLIVVLVEELQGWVLAVVLGTSFALAVAR